ncbi:hypothetical protein [Deinococcus yavapaiensis]|uniref:Esterase/lipase superfamily enzyme n=1 Tax=Deinococcus yavapaiensis KR-236 TaxID=694435 RepID=A0A318S9X3_9DEIO|nr:hypothetical protein [Deinococcus yavapaiensis]PYE54850.1 hypothetical protein DES52_104121 [Deinococcus yavapaiensis KR-236]
MSRLVVFACLFLLAACAPRPASYGGGETPYTGDLTLRPEGTPDVVIFSVAGRCSAFCTTAPQDNWDYLTPRGTVAAIANAFRAKSFKVETYGYSSNLFETHRSGISNKDEAGFLKLEADFRRVSDEFVRGKANPTRIVLLAHSHGANWTHTLAKLYPYTPIALMIDLDAICALWDLDNRPAFETLYRERGGSPWAFDPSRACDVTYIRRKAYRVKDIAFPNVALNLEVQSQRVVPGGTSDDPRNLPANLPFDTTNNVRLDGSRDGIETLTSWTEDHSTVTRPTSRAMKWVLSYVEALDWR